MNHSEMDIQAKLNAKSFEKTTIEDMIQKAGTSGKYQQVMFLIFFMAWFFAAFIQMGFPIIFQPAQFQCPEGSTCTKEEACVNGYPLSSDIKSVAYSFNLTCDRERLLRICFDAFLYGGFLGSLYYGEVIERRGRKYAVLESLIVMCLSIYLSLFSGNVTIFSIGVFFFNAGFRGFYNASLLCLAEVTNQVSRGSIPMVLSIGWAFGQIFIALFAYGIDSWRAIFLITALPLTGVVWFAYKNVLESPRFLVIKHQFGQAKQVIQQISLKNGNTFRSEQLYEQVAYSDKIKAYREVIGGGELTLRLKHHSYLSLFKYDSIRIRVLIVGAIWSLFSLSYFISANSLINPTRSLSFNISIAGAVQIIAYMVSILTSLHYGRTEVIRKLLLTSGLIHICYFFIGPLSTYHGIGKMIVILFDISTRMTVSIGNTFLAIYAIQLFPTSIRHFALGVLGFITKLMYMVALSFNDYWSYRYIHPNFVIGILMIAATFSTSKLRETNSKGLKDYLEEDGDGTMMNQMKVDVV